MNRTDQEILEAAAKLYAERPSISRDRFARMLRTTIKRLERIGAKIPAPMHPKVSGVLGKKSSGGRQIDIRSKACLKAN